MGGRKNLVNFKFFCLKKMFCLIQVKFHQLFAKIIRWSLEKFEKILPHKNAIKPWISWKIWWGRKKFGILSKSKSNFQNFLPQSAWSLWKISWFRPISGENRTTSVGNSKEIGLFLENFWKISQKRWNLKTGNGNRSTSGDFLALPVEKSTSASVF